MTSFLINITPWCEGRQNRRNQLSTPLQRLQQEEGQKIMTDFERNINKTQIIITSILARSVVTK